MKVLRMNEGWDIKFIEKVMSFIYHLAPKIGYLEISNSYCDIMKLTRNEYNMKISNLIEVYTFFIDTLHLLAMFIKLIFTNQTNIT